MLYIKNICSRRKWSNLGNGSSVQDFRLCSEAGHAAPNALERIRRLIDARHPPPPTPRTRGSPRRRLHLPSRVHAVAPFGPRSVLSLRDTAPQGPWRLQCLTAFRGGACSHAASAQGKRRDAEDERGVGAPGHPLPGFRRPPPRHSNPEPPWRQPRGKS